ncbi:MAG TPA: ABC transporter substrate-binding protein [Streptosporangiaceae bacterium]
MTKAAVVAAAAAVAAAACSSGGNGGSSGSAGTASSGSGQATVNTTPSAKGPISSFSWDLPYGEPPSLDPTQAVAYSQNTVLSNLCEGLLRVNPDNTYQPVLASSFSNPTPTTWVYNIRKGVTFWDGKPLTAADVAYSLNRNLSPKVASLWADPWYTDVKSIAATGPMQVTITTGHPDHVLNQMLATAAGVVGEAAYTKQQGKAYGTAQGGLMCTGPFKMGKWTPGVGITIQRYPGYWDTSNRAKAGQVNFKFVTDPAALTNALLSGAIDGTYEVPISAVDKLRSTGVGKFYLGKSTEFGTLSITSKPGPIQDTRIRRALELAIDRPAIARSIFHGTAKPIYSLVFPAVWSYGKSTLQDAYNKLPNRNVDLAQARKLVQQAGSPSQPLLVLVSAGDPSAVSIAEYVQAAAGQAGLKVKIVQQPPAQALAIPFEPSARKHYDLMLQISGYYDIPEPLEQPLMNWLPGALFNYNNYNDPKVAGILNKASATVDPGQRAALVNQAQAIAQGQQIATLPLVNFDERLFMNKRITGAVASLPSSLYYPWAVGVGAAG